ncbi:MAG: hypothetical protein L0221_06880 [Chloroflexi bacterium]|nr:hypothetical protein [Chloroflexota bacterium]
MTEFAGGAFEALMAEALAIAAPARRLKLRGEPEAVALHAIGWATVDAERAAAELRRVLGLPLVEPVTLPGDGLLGARCLRIEHDDPGPILVLLEPTTEARLAASLARRGEGVAVAWVAPGLDDTRLLARANLGGLVLSAVGRGPFGTERLVLGGPAWGSHLVLTAPGATMTA